MGTCAGGKTAKRASLAVVPKSLVWNWGGEDHGNSAPAKGTLE
jgi:hypothetical protein